MTNCQTLCQVETTDINAASCKFLNSTLRAESLTFNGSRPNKQPTEGGLYVQAWRSVIAIFDSLRTVEIKSLSSEIAGTTRFYLVTYPSLCLRIWM